MQISRTGIQQFSKIEKQSPKLSKSTHPRKFGNHMTVHRPTARQPSVRTTGKPMFTLTLLASLGAQEKTNCTSTL